MYLTVWKHILEPTDEQTVMLPAGAEILCAREQHEEICIWFRCNPDADKEPRSIVICGTGYAAPDDDSRYIGTASLRGGTRIFHVFERERQQGQRK